MIEKTSIQKRFRNYFFSNALDSIQFEFSYGDGYPSLTEAKSAIRQYNLNPGCFIYIRFKGTWYAINIQGYSEALVLSKERMWIRRGPIGAPIGIFDINGTTAEDVMEVLPHGITNPSFGPRPWNVSLVHDLIEIEGAPLTIVFTLGKTEITTTTSELHGQTALNSVVMLGICLFETDIPVFQLNAVDSYFSSDYIPPPSMRKYWKEGVIVINPFRNRMSCGRYAPYYLNYWLAYLQSNGATINGIDPGYLINFKSGAWKREMTPMRHQAPPPVSQPTPSKQKATGKIIQFPTK